MDAGRVGRLPPHLPLAHPTPTRMLELPHCLSPTSPLPTSPTPPLPFPRRLSWALVHSRRREDVQRGVELAEALAHGEGLEQRDVLYLVAVRAIFLIFLKCGVAIVGRCAWSRSACAS